MPLFVSIKVNAETIAGIQISRSDEPSEDNFADYFVLLASEPSRRVVEVPIFDKEAVVLNFDRSRGAVELVYEALHALLMTREGRV